MGKEAVREVGQEVEKEVGKVGKEVGPVAAGDSLLANMLLLVFA